MDSSTTPVAGAIADFNVLDQMNNPDAKKLLDTIDSLRALQVGQIVDLPQIIVVGDQSSGKSSVMEALSRVKFPVDGDLCTRFATELCLRRASETKFSAGIQIAGRDYWEPFQKTTLSATDVPGMISEVKERMGIQSGGTKNFSKDILRIEITGPDYSPLTLVDLPGIFHSQTSDQSNSDKEIVDQLISHYMQQKKSIILAVLAANNQLANQKVLGEAKKCDPDGLRTLGVITKPDLAGQGTANEKKYVDLCRGLEKADKLPLGWYVLRNSSEKDRMDEAHDRDEAERRFFKSGPWKSILDANKGVESLRKRLSRVLLDHIKTNLPSLVKDIETNLDTRRQALMRLGKSRDAPEEMRSYLLDIADHFQRLARDAINGSYNDNFFGGIYEENWKLRAQLRKMNRIFEDIMLARGSAYTIKYSSSNDGESDDIKDVESFPAYLQPFADLYRANVPIPKQIKESVLLNEIERLASRNRGKELPGTPNGELAQQLFKNQSRPWKGIAEFHVLKVWEFTKAFVDHLVEHVVGSDRATVEAILKAVVDPFFERRRRILTEKLEELIQPYASGYGLPPERDFQEMMSGQFLRRLGGKLVRTLEREHPGFFDNDDESGNNLSRTQFLQSVINSEDPTTGQFGTDTIVPMMNAQYEISIRTFIENIHNLAVENCLICDIPSIFTPKGVSRMDDDKLHELAFEGDEVKMQRQILHHEAGILEESLRKCKQHGPRSITTFATLTARSSSNSSTLASQAVTDTQQPPKTESPSPSQSQHERQAQPTFVFTPSPGPSNSSTPPAFSFATSSQQGPSFDWPGSKNIFGGSGSSTPRTQAPSSDTSDSPFKKGAALGTSFKEGRRSTSPARSQPESQQPPPGSSQNTSQESPQSGKKERPKSVVPVPQNIFTGFGTPPAQAQNSGMSLFGKSEPLGNTAERSLFGHVLKFPDV